MTFRNRNENSKGFHAQRVRTREGRCMVADTSDIPLNPTTLPLSLPAPRQEDILLASQGDKRAKERVKKTRHRQIVRERERQVWEQNSASKCVPSPSCLYIGVCLCLCAFSNILDVFELTGTSRIPRALSRRNRLPIIRLRLGVLLSTNLFPTTGMFACLRVCVFACLRVWRSKSA